VTFLVSGFYAWLASRMAVRLFDRTEQLEHERTPRHIRRQEGDYLPEVGLLLAASFLLMFYAGQLLQSWDSLWGTAISQILVVLLPGLVAIFLLRLPLSTLAFTKPRWQLLLGALLISPLTAGLGIGISELQAMVLPIPENYARAFLEMVMPAGRSLPLAVIIFAVLPAICEEILFRGAVLGLLRKKLKPTALIIIVGVLFGAFHLSTYRFLTTALLGVVLSSLVAIGGSIFPAMILHASHNAILILAQVNHLDHLSPPQMIGLGLISLVGIGLTWQGLSAKE
jgi:sodium transport system permease protein